MTSQKLGLGPRMRLVVVGMPIGQVCESRFVSSVGAGICQVMLEDFGIPDWVKVGMSLGFLGRKTFLHTLLAPPMASQLLLSGKRRTPVATYLVVISQQLVQEFDGVVCDKTLVLGCDKAMPGLLLETAKDVVVLRIQFNLVLVEVVEELVGSKNFGNLDQLV